MNTVDCGNDLTNLDFRRNSEKKLPSENWHSCNLRMDMSKKLNDSERASEALT